MTAGPSVHEKGQASVATSTVSRARHRFAPHPGGPRRPFAALRRAKGRLQTPLVLGALVVPALIIAGTGQDAPVEGVLNPSAALSPSDWRATSEAGETTVSRVTVENAPQDVGTAVEVRRRGDGGRWALALAGLREPKTFFRVGRTYRMQVYVRDLLASAQPVGMLLSDANFGSRPTDASRYERFSDEAWHLLQRTFVATAPGDIDTSLYLALPVTGPLRWQFTLASVREVQTAAPAELGEEATPDRVLDFGGAAGSPPDPSVWNHEVGGHGWGGDELQTYTTSTANAAVDGQGRLTLSVQREQRTGPDGITRNYTSARLNTLGKVEVQPGSYVEADLRVPVTPGVRPAFWLMGTNLERVGWPAAGELDVMEAVRSDPSRIRQTIHTSRLTRPRQDAPYGENARGGTTALGSRRDQGYHRYGVYFDGNIVQFYVDRKPTLRLTAQEAQERDRAWPFDRPMFILLSAAVAKGVAEAGLPAALSVDTISIWSSGVPF
jgi:beta-glucanase (GH16 family)